MTIGIGLIGCGAIGTVIAKAIDSGEAGDAKLVIIYDIVRERAEKLASILRNKPIIANSVKDIVTRRDVDVVVEAASQEAVKQYAEEILRAGKSLVVMSVGALVDEEFLNRLISIAKEKNVYIYVPSGAIAGIDGVKAASLDNLKSVELTTYKPPKSLVGAPYIVQKGIDLSKIDKPTVIYEGVAEEAVKLFPQNINVVATLSLAGLGPKKTKVRIVVDPTTNRIVHEIRAYGDFGEINVVMRNVPHPENPRTSYIAALSAVRLIKRLSEHLLVGT